MNYSVLISVYRNEKVEYFIQALESVINQTYPPSQIVLVRDGPVYEDLQNTINDYINKYSKIITYLPLEQNKGLGNALRYGLTYCKYELVGRMDTDDICVKDRFEQQLKYFEDHPDVDIVGGIIAEFSDSPEKIIDYRIVPQTHEEICSYLKSRSPFNHMTVMFKKSTIEKVNSYESFYLFEDWYLWVKLYLGNAKFANMDSVLVNVRVLDMEKRRGGKKYYCSCVKLLQFMKNNGVISWARYEKSKIVRFITYVLFPSKMRRWVYKTFLRTRIG